jgi:hypothetical protein
VGQRFSSIGDKHRAFIGAQKLFFVATAARNGRVNVSPKGLESLRVLDASTVVWLNGTGSGNETAAHLLDTPRMTLMFCAFEGNPLILRLYGEAVAYHPRDREWNDLIGLFPALQGSRQIFKLHVELVQTSCGFGVPLFSYEGDRELMHSWAARKGEDGIQTYWEEKNRLSLDGQPTRILGD